MTIEEIANKFNVSKSTVSRALSGKGRIGQETTEQIQAYAREHGMWPREKPKPKAEFTHNIGVVIPADAYTTNIPFFQECLLGICEAASVLNYHVVIATGSVNDISDVQALVEKKRVDCIIIMRNIQCDQTIKYLTDNHFPAGLTGVCEHDEVIQVDVNNFEASESLTSMLINQGYRRFALVVGNVNYQVNLDRCEGFTSALDKHGLLRSDQIIYPNFVDNSFLDSIVSDMIAKRIECIICADDVICIKLLSRLQADGYRIPNDISIASLYNSSNLDCFTPAVTAVNVSAKLVGSMLAKQMINRCLGNQYNPKTLIDYEILFRKSAGKPF